MLANMMGGKLRSAGIVLGCCLWTALPGCFVHHSGAGSKGWLSEHNYFSWSKPHVTAQQDPTKAEADPSLTEAKPELLPWRSRLKGYRLGARLARGRDSASDQSQDVQVSESSKDSSTDTLPTPSLENGELKLPLSVGFFPDRNRPDIVVD